MWLMSVTECDCEQALRCANVVDIELNGKCVVKLCENGMIQGDTAGTELEATGEREENRGI